MFVITSNTSSDISFEVVQNKARKWIHLTEKFSTASSDEMTESINYLDSKNIIKYAEVQQQPQVQEETKDSHHRGRNKDSGDESKSSEGGK